jgi:hypothetical protein
MLNANIEYDIMQKKYLEKAMAKNMKNCEELEEKTI